MKKKACVLLSCLGALLLTGCGSELGDRMAIAGLNTIMGLCVVFVVLILISLIISLFQFIPKIQAAFAKKEATEETAAPVEAAVVEEEYVDDLELVAVISAAIAAYTGTSADGFVVRSIRRR